MVLSAAPLKSVCGIDGCRGGWIGVQFNGDAFDWNISQSLESVLSWTSAEKILIDIPLGLPDVPPRAADLQAQALLPAKAKSSIFHTPAWDIVICDDYATANEQSKAKYGRGISVQSWNIVPKIKEANALLRDNPKLLERLLEAHPELCFNGIKRTPLRFKKKTEEGKRERLQVLEVVLPRARIIYESIKNATRRREVALDDILDAMVLAASAGKENSLKSVPDVPLKDAAGIPMQIHYCDLG